MESSIDEELEDYKRVSIYFPAYVSMEILHDDEGVSGSFSIDDKIGWCWYGEDDEFLLGLIRVARSSINKKFLDKLKQSDVTKDEIKEAIKNSIEKNPSDGLYALLGDNATYTGFGVYDEWSDIEYNIKDCLEDDGVSSETAEKVAREITDKAVYYQPSTKEVFEKLEKEYTKDMYPYTPKGKSWKDAVTDAIHKCDAKHEDVGDFVDCIADELNFDLAEDFYNEYSARLNEAVHKLNKEDIKDVSEETGVDVSLIEACI